MPDEKKWSVESVFPNAEAWEAEYARVDGLLSGFAAYQGRLGESAAALGEALARAEEVGLAARRVSLYASMLRAGDTGDQAAAALASRAGGLSARFAAATAFYEPEMLQIPAERLEEWLSEDAGLAVYRHSFDTLNRRRAHVRSEEVEALLAQVSEPLGTAASSRTQSRSATQQRSWPMPRSSWRSAGRAAIAAARPRSRWRVCMSASPISAKIGCTR